MGGLRARRAWQWLPAAALLAFAVGCGPRPEAGPAATAPDAAPAAEQPAPAPAPAAADTTAAALDGRFDPARDPARDLQAAIVAAKRDGKRIILDVGGEWCPWCKRMDAFVAGDADIRRFRDEHFVWMKVNYSEENENTAFLSQFPQVKGYPHLFVLDADGKLLHSQFTGVLEQGKGYDRDKFFAFLKEWAPAAKQS